MNEDELQETHWLIDRATGMVAPVSEFAQVVEFVDLPTVVREMIREQY